MDIQLLDCTLRDGGFLNQWNFGAETIRTYLDDIQKTCVDIVEYGYLRADISVSKNVTRYSAFSELPALRRDLDNGKSFICMVDYGKFPQEAIPECRETGIDGIRVAFRIEDLSPACTYCETLKAKGYQVLIQPMNISAYSESQFSEMLNLCSCIQPFAVYLVDSFGLMWPDQLQPYVSLADEILKDGVKIGFHFHNNYHQALTNAVYASSLALRHDIILDASFCGAGRGGGNLDFFSLLAYLNRNRQIFPVEHFLKIADTSLKAFVQGTVKDNGIIPCLTAMHRCHPNYGTILTQVPDLGFTDIYRILAEVAPLRKGNYDEAYARQLYSSYRRD